MRAATLLYLMVTVATMLLAPPARPAEPAASVAPAQAAGATQPLAPLPPEVRAYLPPGATSLRAGTLPIGAQGAPLYYHLWAAPRAGAPGEAGHHSWLPSPCCVDLFEADAATGKWRFVTAATYSGTDEPTEITARWLQPVARQGPVLVIVSPAFTDTRFTLVTFPNGIRLGYGIGGYAVQEFYQGGLGGGKNLVSFGTDARGYMTVIHEGWLYGKRVSTTSYLWDGRGFVAQAAPSA